MASLGLCPQCFSDQVEIVTVVLRRCECCGKYFGQPIGCHKRTIPPPHRSRQGGSDIPDERGEL